jgi:hypothetical protein
MAEAQKSLAVTEGSSQVTTLNILQVTPQLIVGEYILLPDTNPGAYGDFAAIWQNTDNIPYNQTPQHTIALTGSTQRGPFQFPVDLTRNNYIVGLSVGPELATPSQKYGNICATAYIPMAPKQDALKEGQTLKANPGSTFASSLQIGIVTSDTVTFFYQVPTNCRPATNKAWVGLFKGSASYTTLPDKAVAISSDEDSGWMAINSKILFDRQYTIALFMSGWTDSTRIQTRMAATLSFKG